MKWITSFSSLAFAGLMNSAAACITPDDLDYAAMSTSDLEDACAAAMANAQEAEQFSIDTVSSGEDNSEMEACRILQARLDAEGD